MKTVWVYPKETIKQTVYLAPRDYIPGFFFVKLLLQWPISPDFGTLVEALSATLNHIPVLAGRLRADQNGLFILCDSDSVPFSFCHWDHTPTEIECFHPTYPLGLRQFRMPFAAFRLNCFKDGGAVLGISICHAIADAESIANFLKIWCSYVENTIPPRIFYDRRKIHASDAQNCIQSNSFEKLNFLQTFKFVSSLAMTRLENLKLFFSKDDCAKLLEESKQSSRFIALTSYLWKHIAPFHHNRYNTSGLGIICSLRSHRFCIEKPEYFGNSTTHVFSEVDIRELARMNPMNRAHLVSSFINILTAEKIKEEENFLNHAFQNGIIRKLWPDIVLKCRDTVTIVNKWTHLKLHLLTFGTSLNPKIIVPLVPVPWHVLMLPTNADGIQMNISIPKSVFNRVKSEFSANLMM